MVEEIRCYIAELKDERDEAREDYQRVIKVAERYKQEIQKLNNDLELLTMVITNSDHVDDLQADYARLKGAEPNDDPSQ